MSYNISINIHIHTAAHSTAKSQLEEVKQLNQALLFEREKLKQKLEETHTSLVKVCPLIHIHAYYAVKSIWLFTESAAFSTDMIVTSLLHLLYKGTSCY